MTREPGRAPASHAHGDLTSLAPHERLPEILVVPRVILRCAGKAGNPFQTTQGNRLSCRDQEGMKSEREVAQSCPTLATPWTAANQAPPSMGFSRQKYWSGVPLPSLVFYTYHTLINLILMTFAVDIIFLNSSLSKWKVEKGS